MVDLGPTDFQAERNRLINEYELRVQELVRAHENESHHLKQKHNEKVEELLHRISEINTRYVFIFCLSLRFLNISNFQISQQPSFKIIQHTQL